MRLSFQSPAGKDSCLVVMVSKKGLEKKKTSSLVFRVVEKLMQQKIFKAEKK